MAHGGVRWRFPAHRPAATDRRYKTVKTIATILSSLMAFSAGAASPTGPVRSAEVPLWLSEGLAQHLIQSSPVDLILQPPQWNLNRVNISWQTRQGVRRDPLRDAHERLQSHAALTFARLSDALPDPVPEQTWNTFQACAQ